MKTATYGLKLILAVILLTGLITPLSMGLARASDESAETYEYVIKDLKEFIKTSPVFKGVIESALKTQDNCSYYWDGKDIAYFVKFFEEWLIFKPNPWDDPKYIQPFDALANSKAGEILFNDNTFSSWFIDFLDARGAYLHTPQSLPKQNLKNWRNFPGVNLDKFIPPKHPEKTKDQKTENDSTKKKEKESQFKTFNDIFLRQYPNGPVIQYKDKHKVMVSPASGTIHQIYTENLETEFKVKKDIINIRQALNNSPHAKKFIGGDIVDIFLWFTDYHYFHAPITGTIVEMNGYSGSYNYNFKEKDWYKKLAKHKRLCYVIDSEKFGLVAVIPVGFWGVGSIVSDVKVGQKVKKGDMIGRFGYGGSSILMVFQPGAIDFTVPRIDGEGEWPPITVGEKIGVAAIE